ncbi:MAG: ATP-binding cassette domain-containing protein [Bacillota bacterium]|nr:ATP-binding cassette domain-containing protein [Bacillota bacterium]
MLKLVGVRKTFGFGTLDENHVLRGIDLTIDAGDFVSVIGGNGAGKSTLLNIISGVFQPDVGQVLLGDRDITRMPEYKRAAFFGRVFQDPAQGTAADMEISENLAMASMRGKRRGLRQNLKKSQFPIFRERLAMLELGLEDRLHQRVRHLSGGQRQALTLLMATLVEPQVLLLDEHTAALDPKTAIKVMEVTQRLVSTLKLTTLMITHNMQQAIRYGNRLVMLHAGEIILDVRDKEKENLTVEDLLRQFSRVTGDEGVSDRLLLG